MIATSLHLESVVADPVMSLANRLVFPPRPSADSNLPIPLSERRFAVTHLTCPSEFLLVSTPLSPTGEFQILFC